MLVKIEAYAVGAGDVDISIKEDDGLYVRMEIENRKTDRFDAFAVEKRQFVMALLAILGEPNEDGNRTPVIGVRLDRNQ